MKQAKISSELSPASTSINIKNSFLSCSPLNRLSTENATSLIAHAADLLAALMTRENNASTTTQNESDAKATTSLADSENLSSENPEINKLSDKILNMQFASFLPSTLLKKADYSACHGEWPEKTFNKDENAGQAVVKNSATITNKSNTNVHYDNHNANHSLSSSKQQNLVRKKNFDYSSSSGNNCCFIKLLATQLVAGTIIGKGGKGLNWFRRKSGVEEIYLSMPWEVYPGTDQRVILLQGSQNAIIKGLNVIIDVIKDKMELLSKERLGTVHVDDIELCLRLVIPPTSVIPIKGVNGEKLQLAQKKTGASINIIEIPHTQSHMQHYSNEKICEVTGNCNELRAALEIIAFSIQSDIYLKQYNFVSYIKNRKLTNEYTNGNKCSGNGIPSLEGDIITNDESQQFYDSYCFNINCNTSKRFHTEFAASNSSFSTTNFNPQYLSSSSILSSSEQNLSSEISFPSQDNSLKQHNLKSAVMSPRYPLDNNSFVSSSCNDTTVSDYDHSNTNFNNSADNEIDINVNDNNTSSTSLPQNNAYSYKLSLMDLAEILKNRTDILNYFTVITTQIPASSVGYLIGTNGCWIQEIRKLSGATVNVLREFELQSLSHQYRNLQISGSLETVYSAFALCIGRILNAQKTQKIAGNENIFSIQSYKDKINQHDRHNNQHINFNDINIEYLNNISTMIGGVKTSETKVSEAAVTRSEPQYRESDFAFTTQIPSGNLLKNGSNMSLHCFLPHNNTNNSCSNSQNNSMWNDSFKTSKYVLSQFSMKSTDEHNSVAKENERYNHEGISDTEEFLKKVNLRKKSEEQKRRNNSTGVALVGSGSSVLNCELCEEQDENLLSMHEYMNLADFL